MGSDNEKGGTRKKQPQLLKQIAFYPLVISVDIIPLKKQLLDPTFCGVPFSLN